ncbi:HEPN family nuclease [Thiovibrio frasassiensis]|uniref:HEPN family nuclease n=1 Tax=Thiovibrio frasassiensis TaxID=2984131 RepID=A0A9X4MER4_9BACT|nr:HEPN family nuclease [Thiovibrio frasassiensis]MDG4474926.1 HEPN family nuclease [Thiovibrio frasassiensis]
MSDNSDLINEKRIMDVVSGSIYSLNFLKNITEAITNPSLGDESVSGIYAAWKRMCGGVDWLPYNLGSIIGNLYCGILLAKEHWYNLLPEDKIESADPKWGFENVQYESPKKSNPTIRYSFRRIRNALGHGNFEIHFPPNYQRDINDKADFEKNLTLKFHDTNPHDNEDTFDIEISLLGLLTCIREFHKIAYEHVTSK